jgi:hypothetical protein
MSVHGVKEMQAGEDGTIFVYGDEIAGEIDKQIPGQLDECPVMLVNSRLYNLVPRHLHELSMILGPRNILGYGFRKTATGLEIVLTVARHVYDQDIALPDNLEGVPLRVVQAQEANVPLRPPGS